MFTSHCCRRRLEQQPFCLAILLSRTSAKQTAIPTSRGWAVSHNNKTAEVLGQILPQLPVGGVFGFVVPQGFLSSSNAKDIRSFICQDFEIQEICLFPDKVFSFSDAESAVILGRRVGAGANRCKVSYRRIRETDMPRFETEYKVSSRSDVTQAALCSDASLSFRLPDLHEVWEALSSHPKLDSVAHLGQGLFFTGRDTLASTDLTTAGTRFRGAVEGFSTFRGEVLLHELPQRVWMNLDPSVIGAEKSRHNYRCAPSSAQLCFGESRAVAAEGTH